MFRFSFLSKCSSTSAITTTTSTFLAELSSPNLKKLLDSSSSSVQRVTENDDNKLNEIAEQHENKKLKSSSPYQEVLRKLKPPPYFLRTVAYSEELSNDVIEHDDSSSFCFSDLVMKEFIEYKQIRQSQYTKVGQNYRQKLEKLSQRKEELKGEPFVDVAEMKEIDAAEKKYQNLIKNVQEVLRTRPIHHHHLPIIRDKNIALKIIQDEIEKLEKLPLLYYCGGGNSTTVDEFKLQLILQVGFFKSTENEFYVQRYLNRFKKIFLEEKDEKSKNDHILELLRDIKKRIEGTTNTTSSKPKKIDEQVLGDDLTNIGGSNNTNNFQTQILPELSRFVNQKFFPKEFVSGEEDESMFERLDQSHIELAVSFISSSSASQQLSLHEIVDIFAASSLVASELLDHDPVLPFEFTGQVNSILFETIKKFDQERKNRKNIPDLSSLLLLHEQLRIVEKATLSAAFLRALTNENLEFWNSIFLYLKHHVVVVAKNNKGDEDLQKRMKIRKSCSGIMYSMKNREAQLEEKIEGLKLAGGKNSSVVSGAKEKALRHAKRMYDETEKLLLKIVV